MLGITACSVMTKPGKPGFVLLFLFSKKKKFADVNYKKNKQAH